MEGRDNIKDLFSEKLNGFEANVRPELWTNISSQIGATTGASAAGGFTLITKTIIGITVAASVIGAGIVLWNSSDKKEDKNISQIQTKETVEIKEKKNSKTVDTQEFQIAPLKQGEKINHVKEDELVNEPIINEYPYKLVEEYDKGMSSTPELSHKIDKTDIREEKNPVPVGVKEIKEEKSVSNESIEEEAPIIDVVREETYLKELKNVFTPNGDGVNDFLFIESVGLTDFSVVVMDTKNTIVFQSNDPDFKWDGIGINGDFVPVGNYVYYITARDPKGNLLMKHSLLRIER